jgi:hypothetical protein
MPQEEGLRDAATSVAQRLRASGRRVDLVLEAKRMKWAFKQAERCGAGAEVERLWVGPDWGYSLHGAWLGCGYRRCVCAKGLGI